MLERNGRVEGGMGTANELVTGCPCASLSSVMLISSMYVVSQIKKS